MDKTSEAGAWRHERPADQGSRAGLLSVVAALVGLLAVGCPPPDLIDVTLERECDWPEDCRNILDLGPCTVPRCSTWGRCRAGWEDPGTACDPGDPCLVGECTEGECVGSPRDCDDGNPCTDDSCAAGEGCVHSPRDGQPCDDLDPCTWNTWCVDDLCVGEPIVCPGAECATYECDPATAGCTIVTPASGRECDDNNPCTEGDVCRDDGSCLGANACDDGNPCTQDECVVTWGCTHHSLADCCVDDVDCAAAKVCYENRCWQAGSPEDYTLPRPATWISDVELVGVDGRTDCCFDLGGTPGLDNRLGECLAMMVGALDVEVSVYGLLDASIESGEMNLLLVYDGDVLDGLPDVPALSVAAFSAPDSGASWSEKLAGGSSWQAPSEQFVPGSSSPFTEFTQASIEGGILSAAQGGFWVRLPDPSMRLGLLEEVRVREAILEIDSVSASEVVGLDIDGTARLGGVVAMSDYLGRFNELFGERCECLGVNGPLMQPGNNGEKWGCAPPGQDGIEACESTDRPECPAIAQDCVLVMALLQPDWDLDLDGAPDAFSVGLRLHGVGASVVGLN